MSEDNMLLFNQPAPGIALDSSALLKTCLSKYNVRLCCVSASFEAFFCNSSQADVLLMVKLRAIWSLVWFVGAICGVSAGASQQRARSVRHTDT